MGLHFSTDAIVAERIEKGMPTLEQLDVAFNPLLSVNNIITITDEHFSLFNVKFLLQGISYSLDGSSRMSITVSNIDNLAFITNDINKNKKPLNIENEAPQYEWYFYTIDENANVGTYKEFNVKEDEIAYMGDDLPDLCVLKVVGLKCCPNDAAKEVKEELADVIVYCQDMLDKLGLDADEIVNAKMDQNEAKYPVGKAKGKADKYNKL